MGKANRPLVVRIRPGETQENALKRTLDKPNSIKRNLDKIILRLERK